MVDVHRPQRILRDILLSELAITCVQGDLAMLLRQHGIDPTRPYQEYPVVDRAMRRFVQWQQDEPLRLPEEQGLE